MNIVFFTDENREDYLAWLRECYGRLLDDVSLGNIVLNGKFLPYKRY